MIVISGALVLVALVLLVIGLVDPSLGFVYASIGVSLASFAFLFVGILQRRKEELPVGAELPAAADTSSEGITAILPAGRPTAAPAREAAAPEPPAEPAVAEPSVSGSVLVVAGRPRYHVAGCRYLTGKDAEEVDVADAREEGFTACGVCKPDAALAAAVPAGEPVEEPAEEVGLVDDVETGQEAPEEGAVAPAPARKATARTARATGATAVKAPAKTAKAATSSAAKAAPTAAAKAAAAPAKRGTVVVIPDRGKFHTATCRYVRGAEGALELTKAQATKQGYAACGVCKP